MSANIVWFTGLSGAGKSTIAEAVRAELSACGKKVIILDGDAVRGTLHKHLGFTPEDIKENNRLVAELAKESARDADVVLVPIISPFRESRALAKKIIGDGFIELYVACSEPARVARDPKGLYEKVREGKLKDFIGYGGVPYEPPLRPDIKVDTDTETLEQAVSKIVHALGMPSAEPDGAQVLFLYETEQVPLAAARFAAGKSDTVVALDYEVELDLKKAGIPFLSLKELAHEPDAEREPQELAIRLCKDWYSSPEMKFFEYDGIPLGEPHSRQLQHYFGFLIYIVDVLDQILRELRPTRITIPESFHTLGPLADPTAYFKERIHEDTARLVAEHCGIAFERIPAPLARRSANTLSTAKEHVRQIMASITVTLSNMLVAFVQRERPLRLLSTDPWSRVEPFVLNMPDVELIMTRRAESRSMGWKNIWRTRARFHHRLDFVSAAVRGVARERARYFTREWNALGETPVISEPYCYKGIPLWPMAREILGAIVTKDAEDSVATIESIKRMLAHDRVTCVLVSNSAKGYNYLLSRVAERMNIPSIELQHALEVSDPLHPVSHLHSRYLAAYGPFTRRSYERFGTESWRIVACGSPRFDTYMRPLPREALESLRQELRLDSRLVNALVLLPHIFLTLDPSSFTSYRTQAETEVFARLQKKLPQMRCMLRPRPGPMRRKYYHRAETTGLFPGETRMVQETDLHGLLTLSDFVIAGNSVVVVEAMIVRKPVVMYLPRRVDHDFDEFESDGAVLVAHTEEELYQHAKSLMEPRRRDELVRRADAFLKKNFLFDGRSSARVSALLRNVGSAEN